MKDNRQPQKILVLDTNVLLHGQPFESIGWTDLADAKAVVLVVTRVVFQELEEHKYSHASSSIRERAKRVASSLADRLLAVDSGHDAVIKPTLSLRFHGKRPRMPVEVDFRHRDEELLATVASIRAERGADVVFVSFDRGALLSARERGIPILCIPEKYVLPAVPAKEAQRPGLSAGASINDVELVVPDDDNEGEIAKICFFVPRPLTEDQLELAVVRHWHDIHEGFPDSHDQQQELRALKEAARNSDAERIRQAATAHGSIRVSNLGTGPVSGLEIVRISISAPGAQVCLSYEGTRDRLLHQAEPWIVGFEIVLASCLEPERCALAFEVLCNERAVPLKVSLPLQIVPTIIEPSLDLFD